MLGIAPGARLNNNKDLDRDLDRVVQLGSQAIRWFADWKTCQPDLGSNSFDFSEPDAVVAGCEARGLKVLLGVGSRGDGHLFDDTPQVAPFATELAIRYADRVIAFEGANEADLIKADASPTAMRYTAHQRAIYDAIKSVSPTTLVGTGGIIGAADKLQQMYDVGVRDCFDFLCWHAYTCLSTPPMSPTDSVKAGRGGWTNMLDARHIMVNNGDGHKQMWITEYGSNAGGGPEPRTELQQNSDLGDAVKRFRSHPWAGPFFWFCGWDSGDGKRKGDFMGLLRADGSEKLAAGTFRLLAETT